MTTLRRYLTKGIFIALLMHAAVFAVVAVRGCIARNYPPPRPAFSDNYFKTDPFGSYRWSRPWPLGDAFGNRCYTDTLLNTVLVIGATSDLSKANAFPKTSGTNVTLTNNANSIEVRLRVAPNSCYIFAEGKDLVSCELEPGTAQRIRSEWRGDRLFSSIGALLELFCTPTPEKAQRVKQALDALGE